MQYKKYIKFVTSIVLTVGLSYGFIYARTGLQASTGDTLTADKWNEVVDKISPITNEGNNIGIGTVSPEAKLHVAGDLKVDGNINSNNLGLIYSYSQGTSSEVIEVPNTSDEGLYHVVVQHGAYGSGVFHTWVMFYRMSPYAREVLSSDSESLVINKHIGSAMNVNSILTGNTLNTINHGQNIRINLGSSNQARMVYVFKLF